MKKKMFNDRYGLTQAVLEGRKTQTRRIAFKRDIEPLIQGIPSEYLIAASSRYKLGETIAIAQSYKTIQEYFRKAPGTDLELKPELSQSKGYTNKMFVRADRMPNHIRITRIRVERLQDISEEDCLAEGIWRAHEVGLEGVTYWYTRLANSPYRTAREAYAALIDKIRGKGIWASNPYVFVYDFELIR